MQYRFKTKNVACFSVLLVTGLPSVPLWAGPPTSFDAWSVTNGQLTAGCPSGYVCKAGVSDRDMFQQMLIDRNGNRYIQNVVTSSDNLGAMSLESFVNVTQTAEDAGISAKQNINVTGVTTLDSTVVLNTGWASDAGPEVLIDQIVTSSEIAGLGYRDTFHFEGSRDANEQETGYYLAIRQEVTGSNEYNTGTAATGQDIHVFETRIASGDRVANGGSVSLSGGGGMGGMMGGGQNTGGTMSWNAGDTVQALWIGQICEGCQTGGMGGGGMGGGGGGGMAAGSGLFGYQSFDNLSDGAGAVASQSLFDTNPQTWADPPFGPTPGL